MCSARSDHLRPCAGLGWTLGEATTLQLALALIAELRVDVENALGRCMKFPVLRVSGVCLMAGAVIFVLHVVLRSVITAGPEPAAFAKHGAWVPVQVLGVVGAVLVLLGLPGMYARMAVPLGPLGLIGIAVLATAWMFVALFLSLYGALVLPWLADRAPSLIVASAPLPAAFVIAFGVALIGWCVGAVLLATPFIRRRAQPNWVGYALVASAVWMVIGNFLVAPSVRHPTWLLTCFLTWVQCCC